jgi:hypothetical protein
MRVIRKYIQTDTDDFKDGDRVASSVVFGEQDASIRLSFALSIFIVEYNTILLYVQFNGPFNKSKFTICSDSLFCLFTISK